MNKTVTANISGVVFHIETDAYEKLHNYLTTIKTYFKDSDGTEEIMADIEARIAELFKEELGMGRDVITMVNVRKVIEVMGEPEQYMDEDSSADYKENTQNTNSFQTNNQQRFRSKKLYRDEDDNVIGGVCSGLGYYFGIDRVWIRALFAISVVIGFGTPILLYVIMWIIMPAAKTTSDKLEMKGEPINVENIGNTIKDEFNQFKKKVDNEKTSFYVKKTENGLRRFLNFIGSLIIFLFKFLSKVLSVALILGSIAGLIAILTVLVGGPFNFHINNLDFHNAWTTDMAEVFFSTPTMFYVGLIGVSLVTIIPLLGLLYLGLRLLMNVPSSNKTINLSLIALLIIGVIMISVAATSTASQYTSRQKQTQEIVLDELTSDTLSLSSLENTYTTGYVNGGEYFIEGNEILLNDFRLTIVRGRTDNIVLKVLKSARGSNRKEAGRRAENVTVRYELMDNELRISPLISAPYKDKYRNQEAHISIALPIGKVIYLSPSSQEIIYDIKNVYHMRDWHMVGHYWKMTKAGLVCLDCVEGNDRGYFELEEELEEHRIEEEERMEEERELNEELEHELSEITIDSDGTSIDISF